MRLSADHRRPGSSEPFGAAEVPAFFSSWPLQADPDPSQEAGWPGLFVPLGEIDSPCSPAFLLV